MSARASVMPWIERAPYHCFGCSPRNPAGLALSLELTDEGVAASFSLTRLHESYPGVVHGGIVSTVLDEVMGNLLAVREKRFCFTTSLRVRFIAPLSVGARYSARARVVDRPSADSPLFVVEGEILSEEQRALAVASAGYRPMTEEQTRAFSFSDE